MKDRVILTGTRCPLPLPVPCDVHVLMKDSMLWSDGFPELCFCQSQAVGRTMEGHGQGRVSGLCLKCRSPTLRLFYLLYIKKQKESRFQILYRVRFKIYLSVHVPLSIVLRNRQALLDCLNFKTRLLLVCLFVLSNNSCLVLFPWGVHF